MCLGYSQQSPFNHIRVCSSCDLWKVAVDGGWLPGEFPVPLAVRPPGRGEGPKWYDQPCLGLYNRNIMGTTYQNCLPWPDLRVTTCVSYLTMGGPSKECRTNKIPPIGRIWEKSKSERRCQSIFAMDSQNLSDLDPSPGRSFATSVFSPAKWGDYNPF